MNTARFALSDSSAMNNLAGMISPTPPVNNSVAAEIGTEGMNNSRAFHIRQRAEQDELSGLSQQRTDSERDMDMARLGSAQQQDAAVKFATDYKTLALDSNGMGDALGFVGTTMNSPEGADLQNLVSQNLALGNAAPELVQYYMQGNA